MKFLSVLDIQSFEPIVAEQRLYVIGPEGIEQQVIEKLTKWVSFLELKVDFIRLLQARKNFSSWRDTTYKLSSEYLFPTSGK